MHTNHLFYNIEKKFFLIFQFKYLKKKKNRLQLVLPYLLLEARPLPPDQGS